jgi:hypothetical protein
MIRQGKEMQQDMINTWQIDKVSTLSRTLLEMHSDGYRDCNK